MCAVERYEEEPGNQTQPPIRRWRAHWGPVRGTVNTLMQGRVGSRPNGPVQTTRQRPVRSIG
jgi:hypothetical protein